MVEKSQLPPLILHPFSGGHDGEDLLAGSRASLALQGLVETADDESVLVERMLRGRYQEVRMLLFLGKDIFRWLEQCAEFTQPGRNGVEEIVAQSFAALIVENPPESVQKKLELWGVTDRRCVFSRAIGIHCLYDSPPEFEMLSPIFLRNYHRFADHAYICFQHLRPFLPVDSGRFQFEIYASEEYSRILSDQWEKA